MRVHHKPSVSWRPVCSNTGTALLALDAVLPGAAGPGVLGCGRLLWVLRAAHATSVMAGHAATVTNSCLRNTLLHGVHACMGNQFETC